MAGTISRGIKAPIVREGDDIVKVVVDSVMAAAEQDGFKLQEKDVVCVTEAVVEAYKNHQTHYTHSLGDPELRQEIANLYKREYGVDVDKDQILVTSGSSPAILLTMILLCNENSEVILSNPGYACYKNFVLGAHAKPVNVPLKAENGFQYQVEDIKEKIGGKTEWQI